MAVASQKALVKTVTLNLRKALKRENTVSVLLDEKQKVSLTGYMYADTELDRPLISF